MKPIETIVGPLHDICLRSCKGNRVLIAFDFFETCWLWPTSCQAVLSDPSFTVQQIHLHRWHKMGHRRMIGELCFVPLCRTLRYIYFCRHFIRSIRSLFRGTLSTIRRRGSFEIYRRFSVLSADLAFLRRNSVIDSLRLTAERSEVTDNGWNAIGTRYVTVQLSSRADAASVAVHIVAAPLDFRCPGKICLSIESTSPGLSRESPIIDFRSSAATRRCITRCRGETRDFNRTPRQEPARTL